jgi:hypothetical protein
LKFVYLIFSPLGEFGMNRGNQREERKREESESEVGERRGAVCLLASLNIQDFNSKSNLSVPSPFKLGAKGESKYL